MIMLHKERLRVAVSVVIAGLLLGFAPPAFADMGDISIGGVWVCRLSKGADGLALGGRMEQIERNIYAVVNNPKYRQRRQVPVQVRPMGQNAAIVADGVVLLVVTPDDVDGTGVKPLEAALQWAPRLAKGLSLALPDPNAQTF
jgi:hypothetical protein